MKDDTSTNINQTLPTHLVERFLENQTLDISLRAQEIDLKKHLDSNNFEYAKLSLQAQQNYLVEQQKALLKSNKYRYSFIGAIILISSAFIIIGLALNKDAVVLEIIKAILFTGLGSGGGYFYGKYNKKEDISASRS